MAEKNITAANLRTIRQSFGGGEISRELIGRVDLSPVQNGLDTCRNFIIMPHGVASNRPGTQFVNEVKNSDNFTRMLSFSFSDNQTFALEFGAGYCRFHSQGATLAPGTPAAYSGTTDYVVGDLCRSSGVNYYCIAASTGDTPPNATYWYPMPDGIYEIPNSVAQADLSGFNIAPYGDIITFVHPLYPPYELRRYSNTRWILQPISFTTTTTTPTGVTATPTMPVAGVGLKNYFYCVTSLDDDGNEESLISTSAMAINNLTVVGNFNTVAWTGTSNRYNIYKLSGGTWGYIGQVYGVLAFIDDNITPDITKTSQFFDTLFASAGNYPSTVAYFEQRRFFAGTLNQPMNIWATQAASNTNMGYSVPSKPNDALRFRIAAQRANGIKYLVPGQDLLAFTSSTEWRIYSTGEALGPATTVFKPQSQNGCGNVAPVQVNNYVLYAQSQGGHIREMSYQFDGQSTGYLSGDLCLLAPHLFDNKVITDMVFTRSPVPILWAINDEGALLGLTYVPEQKVSAWHKHDTTNGVFESMCTVTENGVDVLYMIVRRTIGGNTKRYIEFLHDRNFDSLNDAFFVDSGLTFENVTPATTITGLDHLEGQTVSILADGEVRETLTVTSGSITMACPANKAHIGLPIVADMITNPVFIPTESALGQGRVKNINKVWIRVHNSGYKIVDDNKEIVDAGPDSTKLMKLKTKIYDNLI